MEPELWLSEDMNKDETFRVRGMANLPQYYELMPKIKQSDDLFLADSFHIDQCGQEGAQLSCPAKTIVIYAHYKDFKYDDVPSVVRIGNQCKTIDQVRENQALKNLPPSCYHPRGQADQAVSIEEVVLFDTLAQQHADCKIIAWVKLPRIGFNKNQIVEVKLKRPFSGKYFTVSFIEVENYLHDAGDFEHEETNIDFKSVSFMGTRVQLSQLNAQPQDLETEQERPDK